MKNERKKLETQEKHTEESWQQTTQMKEDWRNKNNVKRGKKTEGYKDRKWKSKLTDEDWQKQEKNGNAHHHLLSSFNINNTGLK